MRARTASFASAMSMSTAASPTRAAGDACSTRLRPGLVELAHLAEIETEDFRRPAERDAVLIECSADEPHSAVGIEVTRSQLERLPAAERVRGGGCPRCPGPRGRVVSSGEA